MSDTSCLDESPLREFRMEKKPTLNHTPNVTMSPSPIVQPVRRRIIRISDSDSDCDASSKVVHLHGNANSSNANDTTLNGPNPTNGKKSDEVVERERKVRYLVSIFPKVQAYEIYELLSDVGFNIQAAFEELKAKYGGHIKAVEYEKWVLDESIKPQQNGEQNNKFKRIQSQQSIKKTPKVKRRRVDHSEDSNDSLNNFQDDRVYNSDDDDSDVEVSSELTADKKGVLEFMQNATPTELLLMYTCSKKKMDTIIAVRPFTDWIDLVNKLQSNKNLSTDLLNAAQRVLTTRNNVKSLMKKCSNIAGQLNHAIKTGRAVMKQPSILTPLLKLTNYQLVGVNWLAILHEQGLNGILADEMGLGKTIQVIAFLAYLKENQAAQTTHLIIVPSSTLDNWKNEFARWCPEIRVLVYYGSAEERRNYRYLFAEGKHKDFDVVLTTYTTVASTPEERKMFRVTPMHYIIFDEAHLLKNMNTQRYETLARIKGSKRILLTGTPLQNNLLELMSLLIFVMPNIFSAKTEDLKSLFQKTSKKDKENEDLPIFEREQIEQAKRIMKPFVLRRLKLDVLQDLPKKTDKKLEIPMIESQESKYLQLVSDFQELGKSSDHNSISGMTMMTDLRKCANHPLLLRYYYKYEDLPKLAKKLATDPDYKDTVEQYIIDDLACMSDFAINDMTKQYLSLKRFALPKELLIKSGKFEYLDKKLPELKSNGHRVLIFSQYVIMLNILEQYLKIRKHSFLRFDGSTPVTLRQQLIDEYCNDKSIFIFLLSTKAGGLGINLTAADTVIIHDIDFNPYNDKQAEDRCHRMGQTKPVQVYRLISKGTIEESMWEMAQEKLKLERDITSEDNENTDIKSVVSLLSSALHMDQARVTNLVSPVKTNGSALML